MLEIVRDITHEQTMLYATNQEKLNPLAQKTLLESARRCDRQETVLFAIFEHPKDWKETTDGIARLSFSRLPEPILIHFNKLLRRKNVVPCKDRALVKFNAVNIGDQAKIQEFLADNTYDLLTELGINLL